MFFYIIQVFRFKRVRYFLLINEDELPSLNNSNNDISKTNYYDKLINYRLNVTRPNEIYFFDLFNNLKKCLLTKNKENYLGRISNSHLIYLIKTPRSFINFANDAIQCCNNANLNSYPDSDSLFIVKIIKAINSNLYLDLKSNSNKLTQIDIAIDKTDNSFLELINEIRKLCYNSVLFDEILKIFPILGDIYSNNNQEINLTSERKLNNYSDFSICFEINDDMYLQNYDQDIVNRFAENLNNINSGTADNKFSSFTLSLNRFIFSRKQNNDELISNRNNDYYHFIKLLNLLINSNKNYSNLEHCPSLFTFLYNLYIHYDDETHLYIIKDLLKSENKMIFLTIFTPKNILEKFNQTEIEALKEQILELATDIKYYFYKNSLRFMTLFAIKNNFILDLSKIIKEAINKDREILFLTLFSLLSLIKNDLILNENKLYFSYSYFFNFFNEDEFLKEDQKNKILASIENFNFENYGAEIKIPLKIKEILSEAIENIYTLTLDEKGIKDNKDFNVEEGTLVLKKYENRKDITYHSELEYEILVKEINDFNRNLSKLLVVKKEDKNDNNDK